MTEQEKGCGGTGIVDNEPGQFNVCAGCDHPKCPKQKCGTCGGSRVIVPTVMKPNSAEDCPDCTPKPPDYEVQKMPTQGPQWKPPASSDEAHGDCGKECGCYWRGLARGQR